MTNSNKNVQWGSWMGAWKKMDVENERLDRQQAALGSDSVSRIKDLNILVLGCSGVGVETSKNLILSNVGSLSLWDPTPTTMPDLGTNFYLTATHVKAKTPRAKASMDQLKSLNPFCKVQLVEATDVTTPDVLSNPNVAGTGRPFSVVLVTSLSIVTGTTLDLFQLNDYCRSNGMAFVLACNHGVTCSIFSDFGTHHEITDPLGEPTKLLAVSNMEVVPERDISTLLHIQGVSKDQPKDGRFVILITVAQSDHGLEDGSVIVLDDMRPPLNAWNGLEFPVHRVSFDSPTAAQLDTREVTFTEILKQSTRNVVANFEKQYQHYQQEWEHVQTTNNHHNKKFPVRTITMFNRLAIMVDQEDLPKGCIVQELALHYQSGGLLSQVRPSIFQDYSSLKDTLVGPAAPSVPQMLRGDDWEHGVGIDIHLALAAVLEFHAQQGHWPALHSEPDAVTVVEIAQTMSNRRYEQGLAVVKENDTAGTPCPCFAQKVSWGFCTGDSRAVDALRIRQFSRLFATELTGFCAFLGGAAAQEVLKSTGKYTPINQWIHHDEVILVSTESSDETNPDATASFFNTQPLFGSRYDHQMAVLGKDFQHKLANQTVFLVGCGALGCEYLKGMALMGVATGPKGHVYVTDMDRIEVSNLSRQFLFRDKDVGSPKSVSGARVVKEWNPQLHITALERKVGPDTQDFFDDAFWESLSVCWNALDNVIARKVGGTTGTSCAVIG
jgi:ubiquitin-activating enzyme E1